MATFAAAPGASHWQSLPVSAGNRYPRQGTANRWPYWAAGGAPAGKAPARLPTGEPPVKIREKTRTPHRHGPDVNPPRFSPPCPRFILRLTQVTQQPGETLQVGW